MKTNHQISQVLEQISDELSLQNASAFRINAYKNASKKVKELDFKISKIASNERIDDLIAIRHIGLSIANTIIEYVQTGRCTLLETLGGTHNFLERISDVPGVGKVMTKRIKDELNISTLEELERAAYDGRLDSLSGIGQKTLNNIRLSLSSIFNKQQRQRRSYLKEKHKGQVPDPGCIHILDVDSRYRLLAAEKKLKLIAPKRFNSDKKKWLPIYHVEIDDWHFTALYSNSELAHRVNKTTDWVNIFYAKEGIEGQATVVTETKGPLLGNRIIRGREEECISLRALKLIEQWN